MADKWLIVGLGNPGKKFLNTRHNAGFIVLDEILNSLNCIYKKNKYNGLVFDVSINNKNCIFLKPQTYMNKSGECIYNIAKYYKIPLENIIVLQDDTNFKVGKIKIKQSGSSGGHKGINSIIEIFKSEKFIRIQIGVNDKPNKLIDLKDWVISEFSSDELFNLKNCSREILNIIQLIIDNNIQKAMNEYNKCGVQKYCD